MVQNQGRPPQNRNQQPNRRMPYPNQSRPPFMPPGGQGGMIGKLVNNAMKNPIDTIGKVVNIIKILK